MNVFEYLKKREELQRRYEEEIDKLEKKYLESEVPCLEEGV